MTRLPSLEEIAPKSPFFVRTVWFGQKIGQEIAIYGQIVPRIVLINSQIVPQKSQVNFSKFVEKT